MNRFTWLSVTIALVAIGVVASPASAAEPSGVRPLRATFSEALAALPAETHLLLDPQAIEAFLTGLDGVPPDWNVVYGQGHHDPGLDDRLFALNRERDARRAGNEALMQLVAFIWQGELSGVDQENGELGVALGPTFIQTSWGVVRFKHEDLPGRLAVLPGGDQGELVRRVRNGERVEVDVVMAGRLIPEESVVYDFSHEEEGRGLIMPVVLIHEL